MIHWKNLELTDGYANIDPTSKKGVGALHEYRRTQSIWGIFLCTLERLEACGPDEDPSEFGPSLSEIDWSGFPAEE